MEQPPLDERQEIERLRQELAERDSLLAFTRSYADRLLGQVNQQMEALQEKQQVVEQQHRLLVSSIECARQVMRAVTTPAGDIARMYPNSFLLFRPRDLIGGDFYWAHEDAEAVYMAMGDCTGHGVSGAILSLMADLLLHQALAARPGAHPAELLHYLNHVVLGMRRGADGTETHADIAIDMLAWVHRKREKTLSVCSAHQPFFLWDENGLSRIKGGRRPIGLMEQPELATMEIALKPGMALYCASDGFADQFGEQGKGKFGRTRLRDLLEANAEAPWPEQRAAMRQAFLQWKGDEPQQDDVLLMGIGF